MGGHLSIGPPKSYGVKIFQKCRRHPKKSRYQSGDKERVPFWGTAKFNRPGGLVLEFCAPLTLGNESKPVAASTIFRLRTESDSVSEIMFC